MQIFLDGSEISLRKTLKTLNSFDIISGLKFNIEKKKLEQYGLDPSINLTVFHVMIFN